MTLLQPLIATWTRLFGHPYVSTYCVHGRHDDCRLVCKHCPSRCRCGCHRARRANEPGEDECSTCGVRKPALAHELGWRFVTSHDGKARWVCLDCRRCDVDQVR